MRFKLIILGGLAFYAATWLVSMVSGPLIHEGLLKATYQAHAHLWRPELNQVPPDMAALLPRWILTGLVAAFIQAGLYGVLESAFEGPGWKKGLKYGGVLCLFGACWDTRASSTLPTRSGSSGPLNPPPTTSPPAPSWAGSRSASAGDKGRGPRGPWDICCRDH